MKTLKKVTTLSSAIALFMLTFFYQGFFVYAVEPTRVQVEVQSPIYGLKAVIRGCNNLNIRERPSTNANILGTIPKDTEFTIIEQDGGWFEMTYENISGYVSVKKVTFVEPATSKAIGVAIIGSASEESRDNNIAVACKKINGTILQPGEEFKWSQIIGQTYVKDGYSIAPVVIGGKTVDGVGGGVCQVSTTIYNAVLDTELTVIERHPHEKGVTYTDKDATVAHGSKDLIFKNTYDFPIQIETYSYKAVVFANIYKVEE